MGAAPSLGGSTAASGFARWLELGREAGFGTVQEVFIAPSDVLRMYRFYIP
jgi:hypothetical protein